MPTSKIIIVKELRAMNAKERADLICRLIYKARRILKGEYGRDDLPGDGLLWAGDLLGAAGKLARMGVSNDDLKAFCEKRRPFTQSEVGEIEAVLGWPHQH